MSNPKSLINCGGFFDVPASQKRLAELDAIMSGDSFWNNREQAQKLIDEAGSLRKRVDPLLGAEKRVDDFRVMLELGETEPPAAQAVLEHELQTDLDKFGRDLEALELKFFLNGPHDKNNCIFSINAGAGGTESCRLGEHVAPDVPEMVRIPRMGSRNKRCAGR